MRVGMGTVYGPPLPPTSGSGETDFEQPNTLPGFGTTTDDEWGVEGVDWYWDYGTEVPTKKSKSGLSSAWLIGALIVGMLVLTNSGGGRRRR